MTVSILEGNCLETLKTLSACSVQCVVTSPPYYGLRDYGVEGQIGLEPMPEAYVENLVAVFREVRRVLKDNGTLWLNLGDSYCNTNGFARASKEYQRKGRNDMPANDRDLTALHNAGFKTKDLIGIPWMVAFALRADGWYLRQDIIWAKPNPMPESVTDRCTKSHEYIFMLSKSAQYFYDFEAILEPANFDGRKDRKYKGGEKDVSIGAHERWSRQMPGIGPKHGAERNRGEEYKPIRGYKTKSQIEDMKHHGGSIQSGYGLSGNGFKGHSGDFDADGNPLGHDIDGVPARNKRDVWFVPTKPYREAHFATFPVDLIEPCILAGSKEGDIVLDPFNGSGTTGAVSIKHHRNYIGCELNPKYVKLTNRRLSQVQPVLIP